ncbi:AAA family ATPase [Hymenobacter lapidiphilus]|uniref:AAA family ATPase n=1 Tax=Hymenobacter lapidiphilus TaxID=2608003 RepID=A0A7Y7PPK1_9BACT|nr:AAA family ATPase [Hymenobacter lapidiphilus]NVO31661.1 AAA family ATPase [Hymenobacter lapidiphilus]
MQRITEIRLRNFRAFGDREEIITLKYGENLLIYGENGSGKSTIYAALRDLLDSSVNPGLDYTPNVYLPEEAPGHVSVTFREKEPYVRDSTFVFGPDLTSQRTAQTAQFLKDANMARAFLSYKEIVRTYLSEQAEANKLFQVLVETLLSHHVLKSVNETVDECWNKLRADLSMHGNSTEFREAEQKLASVPTGNVPNFKQNLNLLLQDIFQQLNGFLSTYFNHGVELGYQLSIKRDYKEAWGELSLEARFNGHQISRHFADFLNEARLSALSICLYLAAIKSNPKPNEFRLLFLDDVFIGLDTSNRLPLLELLHKEFVLDGYQIILTTYDREWFELANNWFAAQIAPYHWQQLEMYEEKVERVLGQLSILPTVRPVLISNENNLIKAQNYFRAKDYPAAGNYLRKSIEEWLQSHLPLAYRISSESEHVFNNLEGMLNGMKKFYEQAKEPLPTKFNTSASVLKRLVFNPASHFDPRSALYKNELEQAFELMDELISTPKLSIRIVLARGSLVTYEYVNPITPTEYKTTFALTEDLYCIDKAGRFSKWLPCKFKMLSFELNKINSTVNKGEFSLENGAIKIQEFLKAHNETVVVDWENDFLTDKGLRLAAII